MNPKTKTKIRLAVEDYQKMFPDEYKELLDEVEWHRQNLRTDMAELKGAGKMIQRALFCISEKLSQMIGMKLNEEERISFKEKENARWFAKEYPQFKITKEI